MYVPTETPITIGMAESKWSSSLSDASEGTGRGLSGEVVTGDCPDGSDAANSGAFNPNAVVGEVSVDLGTEITRIRFLAVNRSCLGRRWHG